MICKSSSWGPQILKSAIKDPQAIGLLSVGVWRRQRGWSETSYRSYRNRDADRLEVNLVLELADGRLVAIAIKAGPDLTSTAWRTLERTQSAPFENQATCSGVIAATSSPSVRRCTRSS